jgi:group II intron reverse transcriptase/maturase
MDIKLIQSGYETSKPKHIIEEANSIYKKFNSSLPSETADRVVGIVSEEGLAVVLTKLALIHNSKDYNIRMLDILADPNFLYLAWCKIKDKKEKYPGGDDVPIQNIGVRTLTNLSKELLSRKYKPKPVKRIYIEKANGQKRPLGIATSRDKIVQMGLKIILEPLFEPHFSTNSHGFRPGRSCHTALDQIRREWRMVSYFINLDLEKFFDKLAHKQIIKAIKRRCKDKEILAVIYRMLKCGYVSLTNSRDVNLDLVSSKGIPQGSIISPLLSNIVLDEFDWIVEKTLISQFNKREKNQPTQVSPAYYQATSLFDAEDYELRDKIQEQMGLTTRQAREVIKTAKVKAAQNKGIQYSLKNELTERLWYVRYADDILFGYTGPKIKAQVLTSIITQELSYIGVSINSEKSRIVHHSKGVQYLSYRIFGNYHLKSRGKVHKRGQRTLRTYLAFSPPVKKLLERAKERGFVMSNRRGKINSKLVARRYDKWLFLSPQDIVKRFKSVLRSIIQYYQGCQQRSDLYELLWLYKRSCALTLAHHHKFRSWQKAVQKYGKDLTVEYKGKNGKSLTVDCSIPSLEGGGRFKTKVHQNTFPQTMEKSASQSGRIVPKTLHEMQSASELMCHIPNCPNKAEAWHHIKHRKRAKITSSSKQRQIALFAKQIPVCKKHHVMIHNGQYNGPSLSKLKGYVVGDWDDFSC